MLKIQVIAFCVIRSCFSFAPLSTLRRPPSCPLHQTYSPKRCPIGSSTALFAASPFVNDFKTSKGEVVNPYSVLKVSRDADASVIKAAYRSLSRRYHPDGNRHRKILPGSCNSWDEVRDHWERIRVSYEILKSPVLRKRYDRHELLSDPKAALQRAAVGAAVHGVKSVGQGIFQGLFSAGSFAFEQITKEKPPSKRLSVDASTAGDAEEHTVAHPEVVIVSEVNETILVPDLAP